MRKYLFTMTMLAMLPACGKAPDAKPAPVPKAATTTLMPKTDGETQKRIADAMERQAKAAERAATAAEQQAAEAAQAVTDAENAEMHRNMYRPSGLDIYGNPKRR